jgi:hypothetical protein
MQIETYRAKIESFEQHSNRELYRYYSGQKDRLELTSIYSDYSDLFSLENIHGIQLEIANASFPSRRESLSRVHHYLIDQHLDSRTGPLTQEIELFEREQTLWWEGRRIALRQTPSVLRVEADAYKRRKLGEQSAAAHGEADELRRKKILQLRATADELGFRSYVEAMECVAGISYQQLLESMNAALSRLQDGYLERLKVSLEVALGLPLQDSWAWDVPRWRVLNDERQIFQGEKLLPVLDFFVSDLDILPERVEAISIDSNAEAKPFSRAYCVPIRVPEEIKIGIRPASGAGHFAAALHEMGHACHFAWTNSSLPAEHRLWGDRALSESYAFFLEHFLLDPEWLARALSFLKSGTFLRFQYLYRAFLVCRCAGKLATALRIHSGEPLDDIPNVYAETMKNYTGIRYHPGMWAECLSDGLEAADYLRGWILECLLREFIHTKYGKMPGRAASGFLKELWETGLLYNAEELCRELGAENLDPQILADDLYGGLQY